MIKQLTPDLDETPPADRPERRSDVAPVMTSPRAPKEGGPLKIASGIRAAVQPDAPPPSAPRAATPAAPPPVPVALDASDVVEEAEDSERTIVDVADVAPVDEWPDDDGWPDPDDEDLPTRETPVDVAAVLRAQTVLGHAHPESGHMRVDAAARTSTEAPRPLPPRPDARPSRPSAPSSVPALLAAPSNDPLNPTYVPPPTPSAPFAVQRPPTPSAPSSAPRPPAPSSPSSPASVSPLAPRIPTPPLPTPPHSWSSTAAFRVRGGAAFLPPAPVRRAFLSSMSEAPPTRGFRWWLVALVVVLLAAGAVGLKLYRTTASMGTPTTE